MVAPLRRRRSLSQYYFTELTCRKILFYLLCTALLLLWTGLVLVEPYMHIECSLPPTGKAWANPAYNDDPCRSVRFQELLWLTREECGWGRRLLTSVVLGGVIGWERRSADRPAGIRTMALVSLGAAVFTLCSIFAFESGTMNWDASRVSAAIPSGVGFLGAGLIWKAPSGAGSGGQQQVHGLTTAASLWLSSAVGVACGGALYFVASFCVVIMVVLLRFGPRIDVIDGAGGPDEAEFGADYAAAARDSKRLSSARVVRYQDDDRMERGDGASNHAATEMSPLNLPKKREAASRLSASGSLS